MATDCLTKNQPAEEVKKQYILCRIKLHSMIMLNQPAEEVKKQHILCRIKLKKWQQIVLQK